VANLPLWSDSQIAAARYVNRLALHNGMIVTLELVDGVPMIEALVTVGIDHLRVELDDAESMHEIDATLELLRDDGTIPPVLVEMLRIEQLERLGPDTIDVN
jgi:hypothetical protein